MKPHHIIFTIIAAVMAQSAPRSGTLEVSQSGRGPMLNEGGITFLQVYSNERIVEEKMLGGKLVQNFGQTSPQPTRDGDSATFTLPAGSYELRSYVRGCDGNCNRLGLPQDECRALFNMQESDSLKAVRQQKSNGTCIINITSKRR